MAYSDRITVIEHAICQAYGVAVLDIKCSWRPQRLVVPRQHLFFALKRVAGLSYTWIGNRYNRHHTTIIHACEAHEKRVLGGGLTKPIDLPDWVYRSAYAPRAMEAAA